MKLLLRAIALSLFIAGAGAASAQTVGFADADVGLQQSIRQARLSLNTFMNAMNNPNLRIKDPQIKVALEVTRHSSEHIWVSDISRKGAFFEGTLTTEPRLAAGFSRGQRVSFREQDIVDWSYWQNNQLHGAFTLRISLNRMPAQQAAEWRELLAPAPGQ